MAKIPFIGPSYDLPSRPSGVQRTVNMFPIPEEPGNERAAWTFKDVPGLEVWSEPVGVPWNSAAYTFASPLGEPVAVAFLNDDYTVQVTSGIGG
jgi:hypothetical protein